MTSLQTRLDKWNESDIIMRWPPEFLKIVGKHSKLWNYDKSETLLLLDAWLIEYVRSQNLALLDRIEKEVIGLGSLADGVHDDCAAMARAEQRTQLNIIKQALGLTSKETEE